MVGIVVVFSSVAIFGRRSFRRNSKKEKKEEADVGEKVVFDKDLYTLEVLDRIEKLMSDSANPIYLEQDLDLSALAERVGVNKSYVSKALSLKGGFYEYINRRRLQYAEELFEKDMSISLKNLAYASGFGNRSTFCRVFKEYHDGETPYDWKIRRVNDYLKHGRGGLPPA